LPSDALITKEDMQGDDVDGFFNVEDDEADEEGKEADKEEKQRLVENRLKAACMWRGGLMAPLPGLPHATAVRFQPPTGTPNELFVHQEAELVKYMRWNITCPYMIRRSAPLDEILIYTDGSCLDQHISGDATKRKAGCAVIFKPELQHDPTDIKHRSWRFRLESVGPTGEVHPQTSDRAELRAVIAALQTIKWASDGWIRVTIASDSAYLVEGITDHIGKWRQRGWRNVAGKPIANRDLSEALLSQVNLHANWGCEIRFWLISRALNAVADSLAKYVAEFGRVEDSYPATPWIGRMPGEGE
jgi:ribonuclease HI